MGATFVQFKALESMYHFTVTSTFAKLQEHIENIEKCLSIQQVICGHAKTVTTGKKQTYME